MHDSLTAQTVSFGIIFIFKQMFTVMTKVETMCTCQVKGKISVRRGRGGVPSPRKQKQTVSLGIEF